MFGIEFQIDGVWTPLVNARTANRITFETRQDAEETVMYHFGSTGLASGVVRVVNLSLRRWKCDSHDCDSVIVSAELPDDWNRIRDTQSDESFIQCPKCEAAQDEEMKRMRAEFLTYAPCNHEMNVQNYCNLCGEGL